MARGVRTFLPTLKFLLDKICKYIINHRDVILEVIGTEHATELDALVAACHVLTEVILPFIPTGA